MQEVFDEFAALIASGDTSSLKIVDKIVYNKNKEKMDRILKSDSKATKTQARLIKTSKKDPVPDHVKEDFFDMITRRNPLNQDDEK